MAAGGSNPNHPGYPMLEKLIFGHRGIVLGIFVLITLGFLFAASFLRIDAGFRKQLPLKHEYMKTFLDYEVEFGGTNRVLLALVDKRGNMFNKEFLTALEGVTDQISQVRDEGGRGVDQSRVRSIFTPMPLR